MSRPDVFASGPPANQSAALASDAPPFDEPWQAQAFAMVVALNDKGLFTWGEWAQALSRELHGQDGAADGGDYYARWLAALERLLIDRGVTFSSDIDALADAWSRAAHATPHGSPIELANDPSVRGRPAGEAG